MKPVYALWRAAMWAGLISLDITGFGPWMVSQPLVTGPLFGWIMGQVRVGVIIGGIVQLIWMDVTPVGVGIPFDTTAVTILATYWAAQQPSCPLPLIVLALLLAAPFGYLFCRMDSQARRVNTWAVRRLENVSDAHLSTALTLGIAGGLVWSWVRYAAFYALSMWLAGLAWAWVLHYPFPVWATRGLMYTGFLLPIAGLGVGLELFLTEEPERRSTFRIFKSRG